MHLQHMTCQGFRCLGTIDFHPEGGINILRGGNAQGKTSVLEALLFVATSKSHRTNQESELVRHGGEGFRIQAQVARADRAVCLESTCWHGAKRVKVNGVAQSRVSDILGRVNVVFFSPEEITLVKGGAAFRRRFMDMALSQVDKGYLSRLQQYRQALRQRNELLRASNPDPDMLGVWDEQLVKHGQALMAARVSFAALLAERASEVYRRIAVQEAMEVHYEPNIPADTDFLAQLEKGRANDIKRRVTMRGPHRDDLAFSVCGRSARRYASQGQQRTAVLAVKLAEMALVKERTGEYPILLLDEVLSELDACRVQRLFEAIGEGVQCLLTTTDRAISGPLEGRQWPCYRIERGQLEKE